VDINFNKIIQESLEGTHLEQVGLGDPSTLDWALNIDPNHVTVIPAEDLSKAIFTLSQYVGFLQAQLNLREATYLYEKRQFGRQVSLAISKIPKGTVQEREAKAISGSEELKMLEGRIIKAHTDYLMLQKMPEAMLEKINALKKELSRRIDQHKS
jgi:hypothetical protein